VKARPIDNPPGPEQRRGSSGLTRLRCRASGPRHGAPTAGPINGLLARPFRPPDRLRRQPTRRAAPLRAARARGGYKCLPPKLNIPGAGRPLRATPDEVRSRPAAFSCAASNAPSTNINPAKNLPEWTAAIPPTRAPTKALFIRSGPSSGSGVTPDLRRPRSVKGEGPLRSHREVRAW